MPAPNDTLDENQNIELNYDDWINYAACFSFIALCLLFYFNFHRSFLFFKTCLRAGVSIHDKLFCGITRASMNFFECTSTEQILELFTTATATVDAELPPLFHDFFVVRIFIRGIFKFPVSSLIPQFSLEFFAILVIIIIIGNYWLVLPTLFMLLLIVRCGCAFAKVSRNLEQTESISKYNHLLVHN